MIFASRRTTGNFYFKISVNVALGAMLIYDCYEQLDGLLAMNFQMEMPIKPMMKTVPMLTAKTMLILIVQLNSLGMFFI